jgi:O-methyltransferase involved in polyketide biosynthesis
VSTLACSPPGLSMCLAGGMDFGELTPVEETALLTEYARALDSSRPRSILGDILADEVVGKIDYDFAGLGIMPSVVCLVALRAKMLDDRIRAFTTEHPEAVVVELGAGLSSAVFRVDPPPTVDWYSVDLPAVIKLRDAVLPCRDRSHSVAASVAEPEWTDAIPADLPTMVVADGLFAFLSEPVIITIFRRITHHFASGMVAFNDYGTVGRANRFAGKLVTTRKRMFSGGGGSNSPHSQWGFRGFKDAHRPETWNPELRLVEEASVMYEPDAALFPPLLRFGSRMAVLFPAIARKARILRYQF